MASDMSKHDWEKRDFDGRKRCKRCGLVTWSLKFADIADECSGKFLANAVLDPAVRTGPYTQAELDRAAAACKPADNVTRIEPFPDVEPYAGDWIPPSHKPRMLP